MAWALAPKLATPTLMIADHMIGAASDAPKCQPNPVRKAGGERSVKAANPIAAIKRQISRVSTV